MFAERFDAGANLSDSPNSRRSAGDQSGTSCRMKITSIRKIKSAYSLTEPNPYHGMIGYIRKRNGRLPELPNLPKPTNHLQR
jgi:hypothetical protein